MPPDGRNGEMWRGIGALLLAATVLFAGCASGPQVGVRSSYKKTRLESATVIPFFARSRFSLGTDSLDVRLKWAEVVAVEWLTERSIGVTPPDRTRDRLVQAQRWEHFTAGGLLRRDLSSSFEAAERDQKRSSQIELVRELRNGGGIGTRYVLFGELLYHTVGTCRTRASDYNDRVRVVVADGAAGSLPRPCIVSHFQARLIDTDSGSTVWYNRRMRELHVAETGETHERQNIREVVRETIGGSDGLGKLFANDPG